MEKRKNERWMRKILRKIETLADGRVNDAVKLAFLDENTMESLDGMDLSAVAEFKRHGNGAVEVKLVDRLAVLEKLAELVDGQREGEMDLFRALNGRVEEHGAQEAVGETVEGTDLVV